MASVEQLQERFDQQQVIAEKVDVWLKKRSTLTQKRDWLRLALQMEDAMAALWASPRVAQDVHAKTLIYTMTSMDDLEALAYQFEILGHYLLEQKDLGKKTSSKTQPSSEKHRPTASPTARGNGGRLGGRMFLKL